MLATIGYEKSTLEDFVSTLQDYNIQILIDIRERAQSRRPGFSKTKLSNSVSKAGLKYLHFRQLGDPKPGREAARSGNFDEFRKIYTNVLKTDSAKIALKEIEAIARENFICLMCYERDFLNCHRNLVAEQLKSELKCELMHLKVVPHGQEKRNGRRVLYSRKGATSQIQQVF